MDVVVEAGCALSFIHSYTVTVCTSAKDAPSVIAQTAPVSTTTPIISVSGHSISAVTPDHALEGLTAAKGHALAA